ncbi:MAG TPA: PTS sugar transporter subunit IIA [Verrucomicrobiae bacterium]
MIVDLQAGDRWQVIDELVDSLVAARKISQASRDSIMAAVKKRELAMTTSIGFGIALPHASTDLVSEVVYVMGRSKIGINFNSLDAKPVHRVILFLVPAGHFQKHVNALADMVKLAHQIEL